MSSAPSPLTVRLAELLARRTGAPLPDVADAAAYASQPAVALSSLWSHRRLRARLLTESGWLETPDSLLSSEIVHVLIALLSHRPAPPSPSLPQRPASTSPSLSSPEPDPDLDPDLDPVFEETSLR